MSKRSLPKRHVPDSSLKRRQHHEKENLISILKSLGFSGSETRDLLYTLNTADRQEQMQAWLLANKDICDKESVQQKAREILQNFLASNPYNSAAKNREPTRWKPPVPAPPPNPVDPAPEEDFKPKSADAPAAADPFDAVLQAFFHSKRC